MSWRETTVPPAPCPHCGAILDRASDPSGAATPKPGDATLCIKCAEWCVITDQMTLRAATADEVRRIRAQPGVLQLEVATMMTIAIYGGGKPRKRDTK